MAGKEEQGDRGDNQGGPGIGQVQLKLRRGSLDQEIQAAHRCPESEFEQHESCHVGKHPVCPFRRHGRLRNMTWRKKASDPMSRRAIQPK